MKCRLAHMVLILAAGIVVAACGSRSAQSGPRFASVILTDDEASKTEKTVFAPDTPRVYVVFTMANAPQGTVIKSVWIAEKTEVADPNTTLDEATLTMGGAQNSGRFWYSRPTNGWPVGEYRVDLFIGERQAETRRFKIEGQTSSTPAATVPFGSKGWTLEDGVYVNQRHGLKIAVPAGWTVGDEARFSERLLWVMARVSDAGQERLMTNITHTATSQASADEFFTSELESFKQTTYEDGGQTKPVFTVLETGKIGPDPALHYVRNTDQRRGLNLFSTRNGFGYIVVFQWAADATADELKELESVARSMGYGDLPFATAGPGAPGAALPATASPPAASPGPAAAAGEPIIFATGVQNAEPVGAATTFRAGTGRIYAFVRFQGLRPEDRLEGIWFQDGKELARQSTTAAESFGARIPPVGKLWFWVEWKRGAPAGSYRFELKFNGQATTQGTFEIR